VKETPISNHTIKGTKHETTPKTAYHNNRISNRSPKCPTRRVLLAPLIDSQLRKYRTKKKLLIPKRFHVRIKFTLRKLTTKKNIIDTKIK